MRCHSKTAITDIELYTEGRSLPQEWNEFLPDGHFMKSRQCLATEAANLPDLEFIYILIKRKNKPIAAVYFQVLALTKKHLNNSMVTPIQRFLWQTFTAIARPKLLVAGHLFRHDISSFYWASDLSDFEAYQYYQSAINAALEKSCAMAVLVKDTPASLTTYFHNYAPQYLLLRNDISMELGIPSSWNDMSDYEKALKHKYAQRLRKVRAEWPNLSVQELGLAQVQQEKDTIFRLYEQVTLHQQVRLGYLSPEFMPVLKECYGDELKIWAVYEAGEMVAFFSAWVKDNAFDMFYIGFDYERNKDLQLYFNMLFFGVEQAIELKKEKLILGRTALDAKARIGCRPRYLLTFLYIRNSIIRNRIMAMQQNAATQEGAWEERHPFKNSPV
jgi:hypothetical protein